jgi:ESAT-6 family protein
MQPVSTTEAGMQSAGREFQDKAQSFTEQLKAVNGQMAILQGSWTGKASKNFNQAMDNWETAFRNIINELIHMMEVMGVTSAGYKAAEEDAADDAQNFMTALPGF